MRPNRVGQWPWRAIVLPPLLYLLCYCVLTFPNILSWRTHYFCDSFDGYQNVWNLWWVNFSVTQLHCSPWLTNYLHFPHGTTLIGHTLNPFNGFVAIGLLRVLPLGQAHNVIVLLCFVGSGTAMFWLARRYTGGFLPSFAAGYLYTFSPYHWAHATGHLQLSSMEWIPVFVLAWVAFLDRPTVARGVLAAGVLLLVELCDFYYLMYCVAAGAILLICHFVRARPRMSKVWPGFAAFTLTAVVLCGPLVIALLRANADDPFTGSHEPATYSTDLLAPIIPGELWCFKGLTRGFWSKLPGVYAENNVALGVAALVAAGVALLPKDRRNAPVWDWLIVASVFFVVSLGPRLHIWGTEVTGNVMPYAWLERIFPPLRMGGCPSRMMVITTLFTALLAAVGLGALSRLSWRTRWLCGTGLVLLIFLESMPMPMPIASTAAPEWAVALRDMPDGAGVLVTDTTSISPGAELLAQTVHQKPMAMGYIARTPQSVVMKDQRILQLFEQRRFSELFHDEHIRYIVTDGHEPPIATMVYDAAGWRIYDLSKS